MDETPDEAMISGSKKMPFMWKGMTILYQAKKQLKDTIYFNTPLGLAKAKIHEKDASMILKEIATIERECRLRESFYLRAKQSG